MAFDTRHKNGDWRIGDANTGQVPTWERVSIAVLMDIRDELQKLNALLHCPNATATPAILRDIVKNTKKPKRRRARKAVRQ